MNGYVDQAEDIGFALTVDQQHWLDALPACPDWSQAATLLKISVQGRPDPARLSQALERLVERHRYWPGAWALPRDTAACASSSAPGGQP